jgi:multidrug efflux pump subunit AcrA (membrane-fusion protein)
MNRKLISILAAAGILVISFGLMSFFSSLKKEPQKAPPKEVIINVKAQPIKYETMRAHVYGTGRVSSFQTIDLISEVQGKLLDGKVLLKKGSNFRKGDLLVRIYNKDAAYTLQSRKSRFLNAIALILPDFKIDFPDSYSTWETFFKNVSTEKS